MVDFHAAFFALSRVSGQSRAVVGHDYEKRVVEKTSAIERLNHALQF
jgi:hypothetical protein